MSQYRITTSRSSSDFSRPGVDGSRMLPGMEGIIRPFVTVDSSPPAPPRPQRAIPGDSGEASICIGGPSRFEQQQLENPYVTNVTYSVTASFPSDEEDPTSADDTARIYREVARTVSVIRVENPSDAAQYVDVERIETIDFRGPDGAISRFIMEHV